jgi:CDP-diacylglycerol--inositol 3-phosphatidyltransferase
MVARRSRSVSRAAPRSESVSVFWFVPNVIGYVRLLSLLGAIYYAPRDDGAVEFFWLYFASYALDAVDGPAARHFGQTSRFGAVLDMVTDRMSTAVLLALVASDYARSGLMAAASGSLFFLCLDIGAHWVQTAAAAALNAASHKSLPSEPALLSWYYVRANLFTVCLLSETHLAVTFLLARAAASRSSVVTAFGMSLAPFGVSAPAAVLPAWFTSIALPALSLRTHDASVAAWIAVLTLPVFSLKQLISLVQLATASARILQVDEEDRRLSVK